MGTIDGITQRDALQLAPLNKVQQGKCAHVPKKAALDSSVWCIRCAAYLGEAH